MYILFSSTERITDKGALDMRFDMRSSCKLLLFVFCHFEAEVTHVFLLVLICPTFDLTLFKWWVFTQLARAVLIGENRGALSLLVRKTRQN